MNKSKRGRKAYPEHMRGKCTSLRLRPDRLEMFKQVGGVKWLNMILDLIIWEKNNKKLTEKTEITESTDDYR